MILLYNLSLLTWAGSHEVQQSVSSR